MAESNRLMIKKAALEAFNCFVRWQASIASGKVITDAIFAVRTGLFNAIY
jgi:hypothetical protein